MARITGAATPEGTARFADRAVARTLAPSAHFRSAPGRLRLSSLGLGTYLGPPDAPTDRAVEEAARVVLTSGRVNVLDTAINYRYQRAERSLGRALATTIATAKVARDEVFVATKVGYLAPDGESGLAPTEWVQRELVASGRLDPADIAGGAHAMSPSYLEDQVERSRTNLGLETLDLVYLHNAAEAQREEVGPEEFRRRLARAFERLEALRQRGWLMSYGLATWDALRSPRDDPGHVDVEELLEIARAAGGADHGFRFLQLPFSLAMPEAAQAIVQPIQGVDRSLFDCAEHFGLGVFTSAPLLQGRLARSGPVWDGMTRAQSAIQFARSAPGAIGALVGQKTSAHLSEDLHVAELPPLEPAAFRSRLAANAAGVPRRG